jgi:hypothetical protein
MQSFNEYVIKNDTKRGRFLNYWRSLRNDTPLYMEPIAKDHKGTTKGEDTIRISGSAKFIATVMARLKEMLWLDNDNTKLEAVFRVSNYRKQNGEQTYILYVNTRKR